MISVNYTGKDQNWQHENTTYWFDIEGDVFGVVEGGTGNTIVDVYGAPIEGMAGERLVRDVLDDAVTDEMRSE